LEATIKETRINENLVVLQREAGIEIIKGNEVFGIFLTWEDLKIILQSLHVFCSPEIEELQKILEERMPS